MAVQGPFLGTPCIHMDISVEDEAVTGKSIQGASTPVSHPGVYELAISRMKKSGVEFIMTSHIPQASPMSLGPPLPECQHRLLKIPGPCNQTFYP